MKDPVVGFYESGVVDHALGCAMRPGGLDLTKRMAELAGLADGGRVLDVACGLGTTVILLSQQYGCRAVGLDRSRMLVSRIEGQADTVIGDSEALPFMAGVFDAVISECSFSLLEDKETALWEQWRVLRPGGRLAMSDVYLRGEVSGCPAGGVAFAACIAGAMRLDQYLGLFETVGFERPYVEDHSRELVRAAWQVIEAFGNTERFLDASGGSNASEWREMFKRGRPGYAVMIATKPRGGGNE